MTNTYHRRSILAAGLACGLPLASTAYADSAATITARALERLDHLTAADDKAKVLAQRARAVLVFPSIVKAGAFVGGMTGEGALLRSGQALGFYRIVAGSVGFQLGAQRFSYAMFFMTDAALQYARQQQGWAIGAGPSVVLVDQGFARQMNTMNLPHDIYSFASGARGLMAGTGLEGSKITPITPGG